MTDNEFDLTKNSSLGVYINPYDKKIVMKIYAETDKALQPVYVITLTKEHSRNIRSILEKLEICL